MKISKSSTLQATALLALTTACSVYDKKEVAASAAEPFVIEHFDTIRLQAPNLKKEGTLMMALKNRKSDREYKKEPLSRQQISDLMWAVGGLNRENDTVHITAPSARALYPVQIYATFNEGIFKYNKRNHTLDPVTEGNFMELTGMQSFVKDAALNLIYIADLSRQPEFEWAAIDAGHHSQNVYLYCASEGLKTVVRGSAYGDSLLKVLELDSAQHRFILSQTVGK